MLAQTGMERTDFVVCWSERKSGARHLRNEVASGGRPKSSSSCLSQSRNPHKRDWVLEKMAVRSPPLQGQMRNNGGVVSFCFCRLLFWPQRSCDDRRSESQLVQREAVTDVKSQASHNANVTRSWLHT